MVEPVVPIFSPAGYAVPDALAFSDAAGNALTVKEERPLPVADRGTPATSTPIAGSRTASGVVGPFAPQLGRPIELRLSGTWSGHVTVKDSIDAGATLQPLTVAGQPWGGPFATNVNEEEVKTPHVAGQTFWLDVTLTAGTLSYWMGQ